MGIIARIILELLYVPRDEGQQPHISPERDTRQQPHAHKNKYLAEKPQ